MRMINCQRVIRQGAGTILTSDCNVHCCRCDPRCKEQYSDETFWEDNIDEQGLEIGNINPPTHRSAANCKQGESILDLTIDSQLMMKWTILDRRHSTRSYCEVIWWEFSHDTQEVMDHMHVMAWNLAAMTTQDKKAAKKLWK